MIGKPVIRQNKAECEENRDFFAWFVLRLRLVHKAITSIQLCRILNKKSGNFPPIHQSV